MAFSRKVSEKLDISEGDTITWHLNSESTWVTSTVTIVNRIPFEQGITMTRATLLETGYNFTPTRLLTQEIISSYDSEHVSGVYDREYLRSTVSNLMDTMDLVCIFMAVLAVILSVVVLYNMGILSYAERKRELATLKVIGFKTGQIRRLLLKQNLWISLIGALLGTPFGVWLLQILCDSSGDAIDLTASVSILSFVISFVIIVGVSTFVSLLFSKRLKNLDMVEVLKGN